MPEPKQRNRRRQALLDFVQANPGASLSDAARGTGIPQSSILPHITMLKRHGLLVELREGRSNFLLVPSCGTSNFRALAAQRDTALCTLLEWLRVHPDPVQKEALEAMEGLGWSRSTTQHRLRRLMQAGLVVAKPQGRRKTYHVHSEALPRDAELATGNLTGVLRTQEFQGEESA